MVSVQLQQEVLHAGLNMTKAARLASTLGRTGDSMNPATISRWCRRGLLNARGERVYLEHVCLGRCRMVTSEPALRRFLAKLNSTEETASPEPAVKLTPAPDEGRRARQIADARAELDRLGV
jgi:hypothetical protein